MELNEQTKLDIAKYKEKGNPVFATKLGGTDYVYLGLLREDLNKIRADAVQEAEALINKLSDEEKADPKVQKEVMSKIEDMEETFILSFALISPKITRDTISKITVGTSKKLIDLVYKASGEAEEPSEPVKL